MTFSTYYLLVHKSKLALAAQQKLERFLHQSNIKLDVEKPDLVFCLGGDGTFLKAFQKYSDRLDQTIFVPIKAGGVIGFYCSFTADNIKWLFRVINKFNSHCLYHRSVLKLTDGSKIYRALNEFKIIDEAKLIKAALVINQEPFETFCGSGLICSTASGSTGYARSINGPVLLSDQLWQIQELAPVNHVMFKTLQSPLVLDQSDLVQIKGDLIQKTLVFDTARNSLKTKKLLIELELAKCQILFDPDHSDSNLTRIKRTFLIDGSKIKN